MPASESDLGFPREVTTALVQGLCRAVPGPGGSGLNPEGSGVGESDMNRQLRWVEVEGPELGGRQGFCFLARMSSRSRRGTDAGGDGERTPRLFPSHPQVFLPKPKWRPADKGPGDAASRGTEHGRGHR